MAAPQPPLFLCFSLGCPGGWSLWGLATLEINYLHLLVSLHQVLLLTLLLRSVDCCSISPHRCCLLSPSELPSTIKWSVSLSMGCWPCCNPPYSIAMTFCKIRDVSKPTVMRRIHRAEEKRATKLDFVVVVVVVVVANWGQVSFQISQSKNFSKQIIDWSHENKRAIK